MCLELVPDSLCVVMLAECVRARVLLHHAVSQCFGQSLAHILMPFGVSVVAVPCCGPLLWPSVVLPNRRPVPNMRGILVL